MTISSAVALSGRAVLAVLILLSLARPARAETCIGVSLRFAGRAPSTALVRSMQDETAAIWRAYGIRVLWAGPSADGCSSVAGVFDALVDDRSSPAAAPVTLGSTHVVSPRTGRVPIQIHRMATAGLIASLRVAELMRLAGHPIPYSEDIGRALGRVLAHEIGHVLLGTGEHRPTGLMRATIPTRELVDRTRRSCWLSDEDVRRLRERTCVLTGRDDACAAGRPAGE